MIMNINLKQSKNLNYLFIKNDIKKLKRYPKNLHLFQIRMDLEFVFGRNFRFMTCDNKVISIENERKYKLSEIVTLSDFMDDENVVYLKNDESYKRKKKRVIIASGNF